MGWAAPCFQLKALLLIRFMDDYVALQRTTNMQDTSRLTKVNQLSTWFQLTPLHLKI